VKRISGFLLALMLALIAAAAAQPISRRSVTVEALEQVIGGAPLSDRELAKRLSRLQLNQRMSNSQRTRLAALLPGHRSHTVLDVLADMSESFDPPPAEIAPIPPPDSQARAEIFNRAVRFVQQTINSMPNFLATRATTRFESRRRLYDTGQSITQYDSVFRSADHSSVGVLFRDGAEVENSDHRKPRLGLVSWGEFGPLLSVITADMLKGTVTFHHWERDSGDLIAVFDFQVPIEDSYYIVRYCCNLPGGVKNQLFQVQPAYHGRIAIDSSTGGIVRLVISADLQPPAPIWRADIAIEYGPVELGGKTYICPLRSIAISTAANAFGQAATTLTNPEGASGPADAIGITFLNHTVFENYHLFRGDLRIGSYPK
jgi:hypothetical protein